MSGILLLIIHNTPITSAAAKANAATARYGTSAKLNQESTSLPLASSSSLSTTATSTAPPRITQSNPPSNKQNVTSSERVRIEIVGAIYKDSSNNNTKKSKKNQ